MHAERSLETGAVVASHYVVVSLLGIGGMGAVYRVRDTRTDTLCAIKVLRGARGDLATRFLREARIASALAHPNIARVHEVLELGDESHTPAIVMELLEGESLGARLARVGKLTAPSIARICIGVVRAIKAAHERGVVHRDLKPDNIFLCDDDAGTVKVLDFGIAKVTESSDDPAITAAALTETGQILGTPQYMAPEQIFGEKDIDARADIWALGVILYQALAGVRPFDGDNPGQVFKAIALEPPVPLSKHAPRTPKELVDLVTTRMLVHARADRLSDLDPINSVLERVIADDEIGAAATLHDEPAARPSASPPPSRATTTPSSSSSKRPIVIALGVAGIGVAALAMRSFASPPEDSTTTTTTPVVMSSTVASATSQQAEPSSEAPSALVTAPPSSPPTTQPPPMKSAPAQQLIAAKIEDGGSPAVAPTAGIAAFDAGKTNRSGPLKRDEF